MEVSRPAYGYAGAIAALPERSKYTKTDLLNPQFRLHQEQALEIYYAPLDFINEQAKVTVVGITPGWTQMEIAFRYARAALRQGAPLDQACKVAKQEASFAGAMRNNLLRMLDDTGLPKALNLSSCEQLFCDAQSLLHTTSVVRYPVFVRGDNYTGHSPELLRTPALREFVDREFTQELKALPNSVIVPLGRCVDSVLRKLIEDGVVSPERCLLGFPHPSGTNGHRKREFEAGREGFAHIVARWF